MNVLKNPSSWGKSFSENPSPASVLSSEKAIQVNIQIVRIFAKIKETIADNLNIKIELEEIKKKLLNQDKNIELVFTYLDELIEKQESPKPELE